MSQKLNCQVYSKFTLYFVFTFEIIFRGLITVNFKNFPEYHKFSISKIKECHFFMYTYIYLKVYYVIILNKKDAIGCCNLAIKEEESEKREIWFWWLKHAHTQVDSLEWIYKYNHEKRDLIFYQKISSSFVEAFHKSKNFFKTRWAHPAIFVNGGGVVSLSDTARDRAALVINKSKIN